MSNIRSIDIPSPCAANWQDMAPVKQGRLCNNCNKMVIDFTAMPQSDIIDYLSKHKSACGRFYDHQLNEFNRVHVYERRIHSSWRKLMVAACISGLLFVTEAEAKPATLVEQIAVSNKNEQKPGDSTMVLKGKVINKISGQPLVNAAVWVNSTKLSAKTDGAGKFVFIVPVNTTYLGVFSDTPGPVNISLTSVNLKYQAIKVSPVAFQLAINTSMPHNHQVIMGEIRIKPGQTFNKKKLIKIRTAKEIGRLEDFDEEKVKH